VYAENFTTVIKEVKRGMFGIAPGQGMNGYGSKISTDYMIRFKDDKYKRLYRVYCCVFSNNGSLYIIKKGEKLSIREQDLS